MSTEYKLPYTAKDINERLGKITQLQEDIDKLYSRPTLEPSESDVPKVFINGMIPTTKTEVLAEMTYISKTETFHVYITIKCQGTSSLNYPKKNFTIKLFEDVDRSIKLKKNFRGWGNQNKFCLKANWIDLSHARNVVSAKLWGDVVKTRSDYGSLPEELRTSPNQGAIDGFPIIVYCNNLYYGRYTWNIPKDAWMSNMDDELETHCILCAENYESSCFRAEAVIDESDWTDELHDEVPDSIRTSLNNAINFVMNSTDEEFIANIENYFNLPSLIDYYLFCYAICHLDGLGKNQLLFTYDGIHWIASAYDMDSTWGLYWNGESLVSTSYKMQEEYETGVHGTTNLLYERLGTLFSEQIRNRWFELREGPLSFYNINKRFESFTDLCPPHVVAEDYANTTGNGVFVNIPSKTTNNIGQIREYVAKRLLYVDSRINPLTAIGETVLRGNYSPAGESWTDTTTLNFNNGDYVEASIDLSSCTDSYENILSVGDSIAAWYQPVGGYHLYYDKNTNELQVNFSYSSYHTRTSIFPTEDTVVIKVNSNGIYVNGTLVGTNMYVVNHTSTEIGSVEGSTRSNAIYNYIKVVRF